MHAFDTPWKISNELFRIGLIPLCRLYFAVHGISWQPGWRIFGLPLIQKNRRSEIHIGSFLQMRNWFGSNPLGVNHRSILATWSAQAKITIGNHVGLTGTAIVSESKVTIGDYVQIGANSSIVDTDFHPLQASERLVNPKHGKTNEVIIGNHVFIGMNVLVLKGSTIGNGSVIGAGSVVTGDIPERVIAAGNPIRIIREIDND